MQNKQPVGKIVTIAFIGCFIFLSVIYDIFALNYWGRETTISFVLSDWSFEAHPFLTFCLGMTVGGLIVHFFEWKP